MKEFIRKILVGVLCLLLVCSSDIQADEPAYFSVHRGKAIFRLKDDFQVTADAYKLLLFAKTEYQDRDVWVEVYEENRDGGSLVSEYGSRNGYIANAPAVEKAALKMFEKRQGRWTDCFGLLESRMNVSKSSYEVTVSETETGKQAQDSLECEELYILEEEDSTVLPLALAEELYGFDADRMTQTPAAEGGGGTVADAPVLFCVQKKDGEGLLLGKYDTEGSAESGKETPEKNDPETQAEQDAQTERGIQTEQETRMESETRAESEPPTERETETEKETQTEYETRTEQETRIESETRAENEPPTERGTETEQETQIEYGTRTEQETRMESETQTTLPFAILLPVLAAAAVLLFVCFMKRKKKSENINETCYMVSNDEEDTYNSVADDEDTYNPETPAAAVKQTGMTAKKIVIDGAVINNKGRVRANNEDNFYFNGKYLRRNEVDKGAFETGRSSSSVQLYAVCDGMGGTDAGEEASCRAVEALARRKSEYGRMMNPRELSAALRSISDQISAEAAQRNQKSGTTIVMMLAAAGRVIFANVGDSRIYRFRNQTLTQISVDHSRVQRMISMGILTPEQARTDPSRHVITQYLGMAGEIKISPYLVSDAELLRDDVYILCSDGLTDMVEDFQIEAILREKRKPQAAAEALFKTAMSNGGRDNVTIMVLHVCDT